jgi:heat shock protein HslJ
MDGLDDLVRTALKDDAALITQDSLRHPAASAARPRRVRSALLAAAVLVLAAGGITTAIALRADHGSHWGAQAWAGFRWDLRTVDSHEVPADLGASASFSRAGDVQLRDGINSMSGRYDATATSVRLRDVGTTFALYAGDDPTRKAVIDAMRELTSQDAQVSLTGERLTISTNTHRMVLTRGEPH